MCESEREKGGYHGLLGGGGAADGAGLLLAAAVVADRREEQEPSDACVDGVRQRVSVWCVREDAGGVRERASVWRRGCGGKRGAQREDAEKRGGAGSSAVEWGEKAQERAWHMQQGRWAWRSLPTFI